MSSQPVYLVRCVVKAGCEEAFIAATLANARASAQEPGVLRFDVLGDAADPRVFLLYEAYRDADAPRLHKESAHYAAWRDAVEPLLEGPRTKETLEGRFVSG